jgi:hypothetical protein
MKNALADNLPLVALRLCDFDFLPNHCLSAGLSLYKLPFLCQTSQYFTLLLIYIFIPPRILPTFHQLQDTFPRLGSGNKVSSDFENKIARKSLPSILDRGSVSIPK